MRRICILAVGRIQAILALTVILALEIATVWVSPAQAQVLTPLYNFCSQGGANCTDGAQPLAGLVQATDGNFYGTTFKGGAYSWGTVFKLSSTGTLTTLHSFCPQNGCLDGGYPQGELIQARDGNLYGVAPVGGGGNGGILGLSGAVFRIAPDGTFTDLYGFCSETNCSDGRAPLAAPVQATDGNFYGTTAYGGNSGICTSVTTDGCGTVFRVTPNGAETTLYKFGMNCPAGSVNCADGEKPSAPLIQASDGNLYGTTLYGGGTAACTSTEGCGTIFRVTPAGIFTTLHKFCSQNNCEDGSFPKGALVQAADGNIYGTTANGGAHCVGEVFKITLGGDFSLVYSFGSQSADGQGPAAGLIQSSSGAFYGVTQGGGSNGFGTVFKLALGGTVTALYNFCSESGCADGKYPTTGLIQGSDGNLYGTISNGGSSGFGFAFRVITGEGPNPFLDVSIDIKPGDRTNTINLKSNGVVPVAILGSATFDPKTVDPTTVTLAGAHVALRGRGVPMTGVADLNGDGYPDLIVYFRTQDLSALAPPPGTPVPRQTEAVLYGTTYSGQRIRGSDVVRFVPAVQTSPRALPRGRAPGAPGLTRH
jgi:uncharacterized repeat protein (TIGR03803 family)